ncbi:MAG: helix-turn-helix domain-containing protein [Nanoarchaeota archaeon]|nr:helix-turn-helix domain-containing protein [Nanoarchaeota archaeon]
MVSSKIEVLQYCGLKTAEAQVYLTLTKIGKTTTGKIVKESGVHSSKIYAVLESLIEKGLVSYSVIKNRKYFKAEDPEQLNNLIQEKEEQLKQEKKSVAIFSKEIKKTQTLHKKEETSTNTTYEGIKGIKSALNEVLNELNQNDTFIVFGAPKIGNDRLNGYFDEFHKKRAKAKINYKVLYNYDAKSYGIKRKKYPLTEVRYLPKDISTPSVFWIFNNKVAIVVFTKKPRAFIIQDEQVAKSFKEYFQMIWTQYN